MFRSLAYAVTFASTGRHLSADLKFEPGFYAVTGSNESGKTMILEMCRFLLFGAAALRGIAEDYKTLSAEGEVEIKGVVYTIERTIKTATLKRGDEVIASGITTVNEKIGQILGFGLPVFDVACSINQGEVERLGSMTPGERKRLIDGVLGIDTLEVVAKWGMEEARVLDKEAETIRRGLVIPTAPTEPEGYRPSTEIHLDVLRANARELAELRGFLSATRSEPVKPIEPCPETAEELEPHALARRALRQTIANEEAKIQALPTQAPYNELQLADAEAEWERYDRYAQAQRWLKDHPNPEHERQTCLDYLAAYGVLDEAAEVLKEQRRIEARLQEARAVGSCRVCQTPFEHDHIQELEQQLATLHPPVPAFDPRRYSRESLEIALRRWEHFDDTTYREMRAVEALDPPSIPRERIPLLRAQIVQACERREREAQLKEWQAELDGEPNWEELFAQRQAYEAALATYDQQHDEWVRWAEEWAVKSTRAKDLEGADTLLQEAEEAHRIAVRYEEDVERFLTAVERYDAGVAEADELEERARQHRKVRELMAVLRSLIKQHLMPSLNKVSSHLLRGMTGGQRNAVYVDENFNVVVDNQRLETLSGSGKACTNLAIRIALGQVLTNKVISVLLADEIDASMDDFRAQSTSDVLDTLKNTICQILLVSHKPIEATNVIELGASLGQREDCEGAV